MELTDKDLMNLLREGHTGAFEKVFTTHFKSLHTYAFLILKEEGIAEEMVQQVFYKIWEKREKLNINISFKAYLYRSVHNECLLYLKRQKYHALYKTYLLHREKNPADNRDALVKLREEELEKGLRKALNELPEQCRTIFQMNRFEGLKYQEVARQLNISVKTVENQMGKALKRLRKSLAEFLPILILFLWHQ